MGVGIGTRIGSGVGHGTSMTDYGTRDDTRTIGVGTRIGSGTMGVGVGTSIESGVGLGAGITDYGAGSGVMRRGSKAMVTDIDTTAADGTISMCC